MCHRIQTTLHHRLIFISFFHFLSDGEPARFHGRRVNSSEQFVPPKPKELLKAAVISKLVWGSLERTK